MTSYLMMVMMVMVIQVIFLVMMMLNTIELNVCQTLIYSFFSPPPSDLIFV